MKKTVLAACFAVAAAGGAASAAQHNGHRPPEPDSFTYRALDVSERRTVDQNTNTLEFTKAVGGLECSRSVVHAGAIMHHCTLADPNDAEAIYNALRVPEQHVPAKVAEIDEKTAGNLTCRKMHVVR